LIFTCERYLDLPVPATPGTMLWLGSTLSYVVGGLGTKLLYGSTFDAGLQYLDSALLYLGLGLGAYTFGVWLVGQGVGPLPRKRVTIFEQTLSTASVLLIATIFILPVLGRTVLSSLEKSDSYNNLVIGALQSVESIPIILFAFQLRQRHSRWWTGLLFFAASLAIPFESILIGYGRVKLPFALIAMTSVWLALVWYDRERVPRRVKSFILLMPFAIILLFGITTSYRSQVNLDPTLTGEERLLAAQESARGLGASDNIVVYSTGQLLSRLVEAPSLELLGWAETRKIERTGWTLDDFKQVCFSWIPKVLFPEKGSGYGRDIMEYYGLSPSWNNIPVTILSDAFRRLGPAGVVGLYLLMGVVSTVIAVQIWPRWGALGSILVFFFAIQHLLLYSNDVLSVFTLYVYRLPTSSLVVYALLRLTHIWPPERKLGPG